MSHAMENIDDSEELETAVKPETQHLYKVLYFGCVFFVFGHTG